MNSPVETTDITVQYINDPKPGKKWGSIKSVEGDYYFAPPVMLKQYRLGEVCKIEFELGGGDGTLRSLRKKISSITATAPLASSYQPSLGAAKPYYSEEQKAEDIFATSMAQKAIEFCKVPVDDQAALTHVLRTARVSWKNSKVAIGQKPDDEMNDLIPEL
jgi:hypothetical protein